MQANEKRYARAAKKMIIFEARLSVAEMPQTKLSVLEDKAFKEYEARLAMFDPCLDESLEAFSGKSYAFSIRDLFVEEFKNIISVQIITGKKIWSG